MRQMLCLCLHGTIASLTGGRVAIRGIIKIGYLKKLGIRRDA